ncbi:uncharacterized protein LOC115447893 [Manduca sexta]|uniref:uncharacterized protein LOC115447893 n=1 Tax=Manduca sexta TaxID=7130 RepID=UPI0018901788|nr:uncharacterized protein LOC115447893 [Manduca sexta]
MTERCQTKFTENFDNKNYIIYVGILCPSFAVLYFYRFHFAIIAFSYVLGCLACYYGLNSNILRNYVCKLKCHLFGETTEDVQDAPVKGCVTCGSKECNRHDASNGTEPWTGLQIHKQLDQAIEDVDPGMGHTYIYLNGGFYILCTMVSVHMEKHPTTRNL